MSLSFIAFISVFYALRIDSLQQQSYNKEIYAFCVSAWITTIRLCSIIVGFVGQLQTGMCLFYYLESTNTTFELWFNIAFIVINWILIILCVASTNLLIHKIQKSFKSITQSGSSTGGSSKRKGYSQILLLVLTNLICWIPTQILMMAALGELEVHSEITSWFVVLVLPINSLTNPFLYTIFSLWKEREKQKEMKKKKKKFHQIRAKEQ